VTDHRYARAYLDFFEDEVVRSNYDWKRVVQRYVVEGDEPLLSGMISGGKSLVPQPGECTLLQELVFHGFRLQRIVG